MEVALYTSSWITIISFYRLNFASFLWKWRKVKVTSDSHGILQARTLEWKAFPFSRGSSQSRNQTQVSCIAGRFFTSWATRKSKNTGVDSLFPLQQKSQPRNRTGVSFLAGGFFTNWALRKAQRQLFTACHSLYSCHHLYFCWISCMNANYHHFLTTHFSCFKGLNFCYFMSISSVFQPPSSVALVSHYSDIELCTLLNLSITYVHFPLWNVTLSFQLRFCFYCSWTLNTVLCLRPLLFPVYTHPLENLVIDLILDVIPLLSLTPNKYFQSCPLTWAEHLEQMNTQ